jgi:hypothetical protein
MVMGTSVRAVHDGRLPAPTGAFISYSREESADLAVALQSALERFAKPWYKLRAVRVFRDDTNMSANPNLRGTIEAELGRCGWLILLASPKAAGSRWVEREIAWWLAHRSANQIMLVQAGGEIVWDATRDCFDAERSSAIPGILRQAYQHEPRWVDLRWFGLPGSLRANDPRFLERVADLAAPLHGLDRADIVGENVRQHRRAVRLARASVTVLCVLLALSLVATMLAFRARQEADRQRDQAVRQSVVSVARQLSATALNLTRTDMQRASLIAVHAYRLHSDAQTAGALFSTAAASPQLVTFLDAGAVVTATAGTPDGEVVVAGTTAGEIWRWNRRVGSRERLFELTGEIRRVVVSDDGEVVAAWAAADAGPDSAGTGAVWRHGALTMTTGHVMAVSPSGGLLVEAASSGNSGPVRLRVLREAAEISSISLDSPPGWVVLPTDRRMVVVDPGGSLAAYELPSGRQVIDSTATTGAHPVTSAVDPTGSFVAVTNGAKNVEIDAVQNLPASRPFPEPAGYGRTDTPNPVAVALSPAAEQLATAVDGRIWVGAVAMGSGAAPPTPVVLEGSGTAREGTLRFLNQRLLISGSGSAVSVWDLSQHSRLGPRTSIRYEPSCNGCGPGNVLVNPSGTRALMVSDLNDGVALADFRSGVSSYGGYFGGELTHLLGTHALWLDDDRLFTWDDDEAAATVWYGATLDRVATSWSVPEQRRPEGEVAPSEIILTHVGDQIALLDGAGRHLRFDTALRSTAADFPRLPFHRPRGLGLDRSGAVAWALTPDPDGAPQTRLQVVETASGRPVVDRTLDGYFSHGQLDGDLLRLWGSAVPATTLDLSSGRLSPMPLTLRPGGAVGSTQPFVVSDRDGTVAIFDAGLNSEIGSFPIPTEAYAWTQVGFSAGDRVLVVATEARDEDGHASARAIRLGYEQWQQINCATAGRDLQPEEWRALSDVTAPENLRCLG